MAPKSKKIRVRIAPQNGGEKGGGTKRKKGGGLPASTKTFLTGLTKAHPCGRKGWSNKKTRARGKATRKKIMSSGQERKGGKGTTRPKQVPERQVGLIRAEKHTKWTGTALTWVRIQPVGHGKKKGANHDWAPKKVRRYN